MFDKTLFVAVAFSAASVFAADPAVVRALNASEQAQAETQRLASQFEVLSESQDSLRARMSRIENSVKSVDELRSEISALRAENESLRRAQASMRQEIVDDIVKKLAKIQPAPAPAPAPTPAPRPVAPPVSSSGYEHVVAPGQTLSLIAREYGVSINSILSANPGLKPERLKVGQKIFVPDAPKK